MFPTTDDGSFGFSGLAHQQVEELLEKQRIDVIFSCGPERMMFEVYRIARARKIPVQLSLERIMKCGIGICGSCCIGDLVLCKDGPVLHSSELLRVEREFAHSERDFTGTLLPK